MPSPGAGTAVVARLAAGLAAALTTSLVAPVARGEVLATVALCGRTLRVERDVEGQTRLLGAGPARALGVGTTAQVQAVQTQAWVVTVGPSEDPVGRAVVHCGAGGLPQVAWAGSTRWSDQEDFLERYRDDVAVFDADGDGTLDVVRGRRRAGDRTCTLGHPLQSAERLELPAGRWVPVSPAALAERPETRPVVTEQAFAVSAAPALPTLVQAFLGGGNAQRWEPDTGSVATLAVSLGDLELRGVDLRVPAPTTLMPRRWRLRTESGAWTVELPANLLAPGAWVHLRVGAHVRARCVDVLPLDPQRGQRVDGLRARSSLDDPGTDPLATLREALARPDGEDAARSLVSLGPIGVDTLAGALDALPTGPARRVLRYLEGQRRAAVVDALVRALGREDLQEPAREALARLGPVALEALARGVATDPRVPAVLAALRVPPEAALAALAGALEAPSVQWREARRAIIAVVARGPVRPSLEPWLDALPEAPLARSRALRLAAELAPSASVAARAVALYPTLATFDHRWRVLPALASSPEGQALLVGALRDPDADLRAEAARALAGQGSARAALEGALADPAPRVRSMACRSLSGVEGARPLVASRLREDPWPTVRASAAEALGGDSLALGVLLAALEDPSLPVVRASLRALARTPGEGVAAPLVALLDDGRRNPSLRAEAAEALGLRCDRAALEGLEHSVLGLSDPGLPPHEQDLGQADLAALARIDVARARALLARMEGNATAAAAVERAARGGCGR